ncbi:hypothetical protein DMI62_17870 [Escherichia coli]|nr:hypothetical protein [Escherichia coli]
MARCPDYWQEKLPQLALAPELPVRLRRPWKRHTSTTFKSTIGGDRMAGRGRISAGSSSKASHRLPRCLTLFAATLERWSRTTTFTLNLTLLQSPADPSANQPVDW